MAVVLSRRGRGAGLVPVAWAAIVASLACSFLSAVALLPLRLTGGFGAPVLGPFSFVEQLALAVLVVAVLRRCELRTALLVAGAAAVAIVASPLLRAGTSGIDAFAVVSALGWGGAAAIGLVWRDAETRRRTEVEDVRTEERMELARELHDVVAHHVTGIVVAAQAAAVVARTSPDDVDRALAQIETAGSDALAAMRRMVGVLRGAEGARTPGAELSEVPVLVERFDAGHDLVRLSVAPGLEHAVLPAGTAATGYRIVQEALTNVRKHAPGVTAVEVDLRVRDSALVVTVRNDGVQSAPRRGAGGFGLAGMAERVAALGGALVAGPVAAGIWSVVARIPLDGAR
jgi:signal transduction histidine kinase